MWLPRTIQNWESGVGTSQMAKKTQDLKELLHLVDEFVIAPKEHEWLQTPLPAIRNPMPVQAIIQGKTGDIIVEFLRLGERAACLTLSRNELDPFVHRHKPTQDAKICKAT
jgi:hypothetical protein